MRVQEARYTRKFNIGNYESEEYMLGAAVDDGQDEVSVLAKLKQSVEAAHKGDTQKEPGEQDGTQQNLEGKANPRKRGRPSRASQAARSKLAAEADSGDGGEGDEESVETADGRSSQADDQPRKKRGRPKKIQEANEADDKEEDSEDLEEETGDETDEDSIPENDDDEPELDSKKKKKFRRKPQLYARSSDVHKEIFSRVLKEVVPDFKTKKGWKERQKAASIAMVSKEFLDENGDVLPSFKKAVKKLMMVRKI